MRPARLRVSALLRADRGAVAVEFAFVLPVLLLLMLGIMEAGRAFNAWMILTNATREAARYGITASEDLAPSGAINPNLASDVQGYAVSRIQAMLGKTPTVTVTLACIDQSSQPVACSAAEANLQSVAVVSAYSMTMITPLIQAIEPSIAISAQAAMRAE